MTSMFLVNQKPIGRVSMDWLKKLPKVNDVNAFGKPKTDRKMVYRVVEIIPKS
jgi:hypothetical protein